MFISTQCTRYTYSYLVLALVQVKVPVLVQVQVPCSREQDVDSRDIALACTNTTRTTSRVLPFSGTSPLIPAHQ
jgi:hypothetical protein